MDDQDWQTVTIKKPLIKNAASAYVIHDRSHVANSSVKIQNKSAEMRKVAETDIGKPKMLTHESRSAMAAARVAFGLTQKELDARCSFPLNSTNSFESGKVCPSSIQIQALHRVLGVKLNRS